MLHMIQRHQQFLPEGALHKLQLDMQQRNMPYDGDEVSVATDNGNFLAEFGNIVLQESPENLQKVMGQKKKSLNP